MSCVSYIFVYLCMVFFSIVVFVLSRVVGGRKNKAYALVQLERRVLWCGFFIFIFLAILPRLGDI